MASKFGYDEDEDDVLAPKEPQVTSANPEERKAGRALRIKRRQDALKKAEQPPEETAAEEVPGLTEQATTAAAEELQRLALGGAAKVTNVKVTTDEREVTRRTLCAAKMKESLEKVEQQATEAQLQYEAVTANWDIMMAIKDPLDIDAAMRRQRAQCDELLHQKNNLIDHLKSDLKRMDVAYYEDLEKQDKDIKELSDRIEKQITIMQRAYEKQLSLIEAAINIEREAMVDYNSKRWESLYKLRDKDELQHIDYKFEQLEEHKQDIESIMWDSHDKYRQAKIELETLIQELQKELEKLKATCLINTEKIGYNYQILKKREEENVFVRSQQKRKLNKMSDIANSLRSKIRKAAEEGGIEEMKADEEIVKLMLAMDEMERKSDHFAQVNNYKFGQVWRMCTATCSELVKELRQAEVAMHAHILSEPPPLAPPPPPTSPLVKLEPVEDDKGVETQIALNADENNAAFNNAKDKLVRHILQLVADNTGFLIEDRLLTLIEKYQPSSRNLCTLDAIFMALEIQAEEDIELLCKTFLNYAFCPICLGMEDARTSDLMEHDSDEPVTSRGRASSVRARVSVARSQSCSTSRSVGFRQDDLAPEELLLMTEADEIIQKCGDPQAPAALVGTSQEATGAASTARRAGARGVTVAASPVQSAAGWPNPFLCPEGHTLEIEAMQVLAALGDFITAFVPPDKKKLYDVLDGVKPPNFVTQSRGLRPEQIEQYWTTWQSMYSAEKDRFWDGLLAGLNNYLPVLQERERLHADVVALRRRNAALRRLVRGALPELPPARSRPPPAFTAPAPDTARLPRI